MICKTTETCFFELLRNCSDVKCKKKSLCLHFCDNRSEAVCKENGKIYRLINTDRKHKILSIHIDGGVIVTDKDTPPNTSKCDYVYLFDTENETTVAVLIELKGTDITKAIEQIKNTLSLFPDTFKKCAKVYGRIVFSGGTPNIQNVPPFMSLQRDLKRRNGNLSAAEAISDKIEDFC